MEKEISLSEIFQAVLDNKVNIALVSALFSILVISYSILIEEKIYESSILLSYTDESGNTDSSSMSSLSALAGVSGTNKQKEEEEALGILTSITFLNNFILTHKLESHLNISADDEERAKAMKLKNILTVVRERGSPLIKVRLRWKDPQLTAEWTNLLIEELNSYIKERNIRIATNQNEYLKRALANESSKSVKEKIALLMENNYQTLALADSNQEYVYMVIDKAYSPNGPYSPDILLRFIITVLFSSLLASMWFVYKTIRLRFKLS